MIILFKSNHMTILQMLQTLNKLNEKFNEAVSLKSSSEQLEETQNLDDDLKDINERKHLIGELSQTTIGEDLKNLNNLHRSTSNE